MGSGVCGVCADHVLVLKKYAEEFRVGNFAIAEATLQHALAGTARQEGTNRSGYQLAGAGGGALLGSIVFPGIGTVLGGMLGNIAGQAVANEGAHKTVAWMQADLLFCLGLIYARTSRLSEARQAWIKALSVHPDHAPSRSALQGA